MKKRFGLPVMVLLCSLAFNAIADSSVDAVWNCKLNEGKEMDDVHAANAEWVKHVNANTDVGTITSATSEAIVGDQGNFYFVDTYPSLSAWAAVQEYVDSDAGEAAMESITSDFEGIFDCKKSTLYKTTQN